MHVIFYVAKIHILWKNAMLDGIESVIKVQISVIFLHKNQALAADFAVIVCKASEISEVFGIMASGYEKKTASYAILSAFFTNFAIRTKSWRIIKQKTYLWQKN